MALDPLAPVPAGQTPERTPTFFDQFEAGLRTENVIGSAISTRPLPDASSMGPRTGAPDDFYAFDYLTPDEKAIHGKRFFGARSTRDMDVIRKQIADEDKARQVIAKGPLPEWLVGITAGIVDPTTYIPFGGQLLRGARVGTTAMRVGGEAAGGALLQEGLLQATQRTRTTEESIASVLMAATLGTGMGFGLGLLTRRPLDIPDAMREAATVDTTAILRSTGQGDVGFNPAPLLSSTAVGRFLDLDTRPIIHGLPGGAPARAELPTPELTAAMREANPAPFTRAETAMAEVARLQDEVSRLEAKGGGVFSNKVTDLDPDTQLRLDDARARLADPATPARMRPDLQREVDSILESTTYERDYSRGLENLDEATARWERADRELADYVAEARLELEHLDKALGPKLEANAAARAAAEAIEYQRLLADELEQTVAKQSWADVLAYTPKGLPQSVKDAPALGPLPVDLTGSRNAGGDGSLSAAATRMADKSELVGHSRIAPIVAKLRASKLVAPALELGASVFRASREAVQRVVDTGLITKGAAQGFSDEVSMQTLIKRYDAPLYQAAQATSQLYSDYRKAGGPMDRADFYKEIGFVMRRSDKSDIPQIAEAAKVWRAVEQGMTKEAIDLGLYPKDLDPKTAPSYFTRVYNVDMLRDPVHRAGFQSKLASWLARIDPDMKKVASKAEYQDMASQIVDNIMRTPQGRLPHTIDAPNVRGPLKERTLLIPDEYIEKYLESNVLTVMSYFTRTLAADIAFHTKFKDGNKGLKDALAKIKEEAQDMIAGLQAKTKVGKPEERAAATKTFAREAAAIQARMEREMVLLEELTARVRGINLTPASPAYQGLARVGKGIRTLNYMRLLGSSILSQLPDVGKIVMEEGLARTLGAVVGDAATGFKGIRMGLREAQAAGTAWDIHGSSRISALMDLGERYIGTTKFEKGMDAASHYFSIANLMAPWNVAMKSVTSSLVSTRILNAVERMVDGKAISQRDMRKLAQAGISRELAERIAAQRQHFEDHAGGLRLANTAAWKDQIAVDAFRNALVRDVDNTVITPGAGDAPLWTSTEWGKTLFQFKRFSSAATQRILVSGLQASDMQALNGVLVMFGMGIVATYLRDITNPDPKRKERSVRGWIKEGVDRSGTISMFMEMDSIFDKFTGGWGVARALSGEEANRFAGQNFVERTLGPTAGFAADVARAVQGATSGDLTTADLHKMRRLIPGQNLLFARWAFDQMEQGTAATFGLPAKEPRGGAKGRLP